jgi:Beta/Gamma crystallin
MGIKTALAVSATLAIAATAWAQTDKMAPIGQGEATIYRDLNFQGPAVFVGEAKENLGLAWPVRSIRVRSGTWELCARTRYRSPCARVSADESDLRRVSRVLYAVQSMRPIGYAPPVQPDPPAGTSLRGMSAEFFPAPGRNGYRILSCPNGGSTANCAAQTADNYCKSLGYGGSASQTQETVNRRVYLADVLCTRTGY